MPKPYDSVFKDLLQRDPAGWAELALGRVPGRLTIVDSDIATVSGAADKVVLREGPDPSILHFEAFASWDSTLPARAMNYNAALHRRHAVPVDTIFVVLRPEASHSSLTGEYRVVSPLTGRANVLQYGLFRVWELDLETVLSGSLATLPLAPITDAAAARLPEVLREVRTRLEAEAAPEEQKDLLTDTFVLLGLRQPSQAVAQLFRGAFGMRESSTYQMILDEGRQEGRQEGRLQEAARLLFLLGTARLGEPDAATRQRIESEAELAQVETWLQNLNRAESWADLLGSGDQSSPRALR